MSVQDKPDRQSFTRYEDIKILNFIIDKEVYRRVKGVRIWMELSQKFDSEYNIQRSWMSLKERYLKRIVPNLAKFQRGKEKMEDLLQPFAKSSQPVKNKVISAATGQHRNAYSKEEDKKIIKYVLSTPIQHSIRGNKFWEIFQQQGLLKSRSWSSVKNRFLRHIIPNAEDYLEGNDYVKLKRVVREDLPFVDYGDSEDEEVLASLGEMSRSLGRRTKGFRPIASTSTDAHAHAFNADAEAEAEAEFEFELSEEEELEGELIDRCRSPSTKFSPVVLLERLDVEKLSAGVSKEDCGEQAPRKDDSIVASGSGDQDQDQYQDQRQDQDQDQARHRDLMVSAQLPTDVLIAAAMLRSDKNDGEENNWNATFAHSPGEVKVARENVLPPRALAPTPVIIPTQASAPVITPGPPPAPALTPDSTTASTLPDALRQASPHPPTSTIAPAPAAPAPAAPPPGYFFVRDPPKDNSDTFEDPLMQTFIVDGVVNTDGASVGLGVPNFPVLHPL